MIQNLTTMNLLFSINQQIKFNSKLLQEIRYRTYLKLTQLMILKQLHQFKNKKKVFKKRLKNSKQL